MRDKRYNEASAQLLDVFVFMPLSTGNGFTGATGISGSIVVKLCKSGESSFSTITPTVTEIGSGIYRLTLATADCDTQGEAILQVSESTAITQYIALRIVSPTVTVASASVTTVSNVASDETITVHDGGDYDGANALTLTLEDFTGYDTTGATFKMYYMTEDDYIGAGTTWTEIGTVAQDSPNPGNGSQDLVLTISLTNAETALLSTTYPPSTKRLNHQYQIVMTTSGAKVQYLADAPLIVSKGAVG